jgi:DNA polymerase
MDPARRQRILRQHLRTEQLLGLDMVPRGEPPAPPVEPPAPPPSTGSVSAQVSAADPPASPVGESPAPAVTHEPMAREQRIVALEQMDQREVRGCTLCGLCDGRTNTVFGEGDPEAPIMFVGEGPGQSEDEQGRPFVGRAGDLLTKMINAMGYDREQVYIANVVKCRPPNNRTPSAIEVQTCWDYLRRQIEIIRPSVIVTVGGPATKMVLDVKTGITKLRGTWHQYTRIDPPIPVMPTFHPAFLLRAYTKENRAKVWSDLQQVIERVQS